MLPLCCSGPYYRAEQGRIHRYTPGRGVRAVIPGKQTYCGFHSGDADINGL